MRETKPPHPLILEQIDKHYTYNPDAGIVCKQGVPIGTPHKYLTSTYIRINVAINSEDYLLLQSSCFAHHIVWYLTYGIWVTDKYIDHLDGDGTNNKSQPHRISVMEGNIIKTRQVSIKECLGIL